MSQIPPQVHETIEQFFKSSSTWSLFSFLQYREGNERSSGNVHNFWTTIEKKRYGDRIGIARADGVLRMLEGTTAGQQHVFNIQQQDLLGLYQSGDNDLVIYCVFPYLQNLAN
uniref:Uncharacterized protein n=1 Tax=Rhizophagus irregularis (strain DAOM 181602 / DAOM 197198 / MUCL 43194) TaxID=747089 RepID=U9T6A3_RHIID